MDGHLLVLISSPPPNVFTSADDMKGRCPRQRFCPGRALPAYTTAVIESLTGLYDQLDVS